MAHHLEILLRSQALRDQHMMVTVRHHDMIYPVIWDHRHQARVEIWIDLPTRVIMEFSGKNPDRDTVIDDDGAILEDKHILVSNIWLDRFAIDGFFLKKLTQRTAKGEINSNYVGHNGLIALDMDQRNVFLQIQKWRSLGRGLVDQ